jgi:hypothetical protein
MSLEELTAKRAKLGERIDELQTAIRATKEYKALDDKKTKLHLQLYGRKERWSYDNQTDPDPNCVYEQEKREKTRLEEPFLDTSISWRDIEDRIRPEVYQAMKAHGIAKSKLLKGDLERFVTALVAKNVEVNGAHLRELEAQHKDIHLQIEETEETMDEMQKTTEVQDLSKQQGLLYSQIYEASIQAKQTSKADRGEVHNYEKEKAFGVLDQVYKRVMKE